MGCRVEILRIQQEIAALEAISATAIDKLGEFFEGCVRDGQFVDGPLERVSVLGWDLELSMEQFFSREDEDA